MTTITETCACGASFIAVERYPSDARLAAGQWREGHKHAESVGICGDRPRVAGFPEHLPVPYCVLKAGHTGMHGDGDGAHWGHSGPETALAADSATSEASGVSVDPDEDGRAL